MGLSEIYGQGGSKYNVQTALYRFSVLSKVWGLPCRYGVKMLTSENRSTIAGVQMSETMERLLFLYGAGIIDFTVVTNLTTRDMADVDMTDVVADAEKRLVQQCKEYDGVRISDDMVSQVLLCCGAARRYMPEDKLTFDEAVELCTLPTVKIVKNFVKVTDKKLLESMVKNNEKFGICEINDEEVTISPEHNENILGNEQVQNGNTEHRLYPIALSPKRVLFYDKIQKLTYGAEFLEYAVTYGYTLDDDYEEQYRRYMQRIKCRFSIRTYHRRRNVCGEIFNNFDYCSNVNNTAVQPDEEDTIDLSPENHKTDKELIYDAMMKFCEKHKIRDDSVFEIHNQGKIKLYAYHKCQYIEIDNDTFRKALFDYDKLWKTIQDYSTTHGIVVHEGQVEIPVELMDKFTDDEKPFAKALIREQYSRQLEQNSKRVISTLSELLTSASEQMAAQQALDAAQAALKKDKAEKKANRKPTTEG